MVAVALSGRGRREHNLRTRHVGGSDAGCQQIGMLISDLTSPPQPSLMVFVGPKSDHTVYPCQILTVRLRKFCLVDLTDVTLAFEDA